MKRFIGFISVIALMFVISQPTEAQSNTKYIDMDKLSPELQVQVLQSLKDSPSSTSQFLNEVGKFDWEGMGKGVGTTIREALLAVVDVADKFGDTNVGKFTLYMVAWKVMGKDVIRIIIGLVFLFIFTIFMFKQYKNNFTAHRIAIEDNGWKFWLPKKYQIIEEPRYDGYQFVKWLNVVLLLGGFAITYAIMFA